MWRHHNKNCPVLMPISPVLITRSICVLEVKNNKELVSCTFIARFADGTEKMLNSKEWSVTGLTPKSMIGNYIMDEHNCALYYKDWSKNPHLGTMKNNYPPSTIDTDIVDLLKNSKFTNPFLFQSF